MSEIASQQAEEYPWRILIEHSCEGCGCGFSSTKPSPRFCSHKCYLESSVERISKSSRALWADGGFRSKIQAARKLAGYPDPNRPEQIVKRKLRSAVKNALRRCLSWVGLEKSGHTYDLLGYTPADLKAHIEGLFLPGMTWGNYGEWEIDHIHPISRFQDGTPICVINSLSNLQPLWRSDNRIKGAHVSV